MIEKAEYQLFDNSKIEIQDTFILFQVPLASNFAKCVIKTFYIQ
jgi:hypothetical protein